MKKDDPELWKDCHSYLYHKLHDAILLTTKGQPYPDWEGCIVTDPGDPAYQAFLLEQAQLHIDKLPDSSGICIDRMDRMRFYNPNRDDGVSFYQGKPAASLVTSWHEIMGKLGPMMHDADKVVFGNPLCRRLDLLREVDGVYDETSHYGHSVNLCALLCLRKPSIGWTVGIKDPDYYFQRYLYLGVYPTAPVPGNDHCILPNPKIEEGYFDYAPLLNAMRGKKWVLQAHVIEVVSGEAKVNLFEIPGGYVIPVVYGGEQTSVKVILRDLPRLPGQDKFLIEAIHPGVAKPTSLQAVEEGSHLILDIPLVHGCAMVKLSSACGKREPRYNIQGRFTNERTYSLCPQISGVLKSLGLRVGCVFFGGTAWAV